MPLNDLVAPQAIIPALKVNNKKQALHELATRAAELTGRTEREIFDVLMQREKLGSTGVGSGIAIPHGKLAKLERLFGLFARLDRAIDFEALDGQPVDLIFVLLAPEGAGADHLKALARVARLLRDPDVANKLRDAHAAEAIYAVLANRASTRSNLLDLLILLQQPVHVVRKSMLDRRGRCCRNGEFDKYPIKH